MQQWNTGLDGASHDAVPHAPRPAGPSGARPSEGLAIPHDPAFHPGNRYPKDRGIGLDLCPLFNAINTSRRVSAGHP